MRIVPPIVVADGWDLTFYRAEEDVALDLEAWYPDEVGYRAFDSVGRRLELVAGERVTVRALESAPTGAEELQALLREWLPMVGVEPPEDADLLALAVERGGLWEPVTGWSRGVAVAILVVVVAVGVLLVAVA